MKTKSPDYSKFPQICIVEASAGAGKTHALAMRYIQLLLNPCINNQSIPLRTILAITFTNKASCEMKERILEFLKRIALDVYESKHQKKDIISSLSLDSDAARKKAYSLVEYLINNYHFFQVQTIDSFINSILKGCSYNLKLSSDFRIKREYADYLEYTLDTFIDRALADKNISDVFDNFLKQYIYLENKSGWFPKKDILDIMSMLFEDTNKYGESFKKSSIANKDIIALKKKIFLQHKKLNEILPEGTYKKFADNVQLLLSHGNDSFSIDEISPSLLKKDFPIKKNYDVPVNVKKLWDNIRENVRKLAEAEAFSRYNCYLDMFVLLDEEFKKLAGKDDVLFLGELNKEAHGLFDDDSFSVPELYYRLAARFKHYLIDEFQDTSNLQWKNLYPMVEEALSTDGSLFYVGDKKQAIYRFRGGDTSLFDAVSSDFNISNTAHDVLDKNFRSQKEIVEFNNNIFSESNIMRFIASIVEHENGKNKNFLVFGQPEAAEEITRIFKDSRQVFLEKNKDGHVNIQFLEPSDTDDTETIVRKEVLSCIRSLKDRFSYKDIALLARDNDDVKLFTEWLLNEEVPVESDKTLNIREHPLIKELISFLKFLHSPIDNLSFASFISGNIFLNASGLDSEIIEKFIFGLRGTLSDSHPVYLYREFRVLYPDVWNNVIEEFFKNVGFVPLYELLISILNTYKVMERFSDNQGYIMRFLELIKEKEEDYPDIASFIEYYDTAKNDDMYLNVTETDSVKVLTIHKAKGLQFNTVLIPFMGINPKVNSRIIVSDEKNLELVYLKTKYRDFSVQLSNIWRQEYIRSLIDELNGVYVAFTRARYELYAWVPEKISNSHNLARLFLPEAKIERGEKIEYKALKKAPEPILRSLPISQYKDWIPLLKGEFTSKNEVLYRDNIQHGKLMHYILSFVGNLVRTDTEGTLRMAVEKADYLYPGIGDNNQILTHLNTMIKKDILKPLFFVPDGIVYQEKEIVDISGRACKIDRLIVKDREVNVVDYKSVHEDLPEYSEQVRDYMHIVKTMYPSKHIRGFLLYLDDFNIEEIDE